RDIIRSVTVSVPIHSRIPASVPSPYTTFFRSPGRDPPRDVVGLAARVDEHHAVEPGLRGHRGEQALGELDERLLATMPAEAGLRSEEHTSELQSQSNLVCRLLLEKKKTISKPC